MVQNLKNVAAQNHTTTSNQLLQHDNRIDSLETTQQSTNPKVAFSYYDVNPSSGYSQGDSVAYRYRRFDEDSNYDRANRRFVCPYTGIYFFSVLFTAHLNSIDRVTLRIGNARLADIHVFYDSAERGASSGSASVVVKCNANSYVHVVTEDSGSLCSHSSYVHAFSGFLITKVNQ